MGNRSAGRVWMVCDFFGASAVGVAQRRASVHWCRNMMRYLRLFAAFVRFSFSKSLEFRLDFFFRIGMDIIWNIVNISFFWLLYQHTPVLGGWTFDQMLIFMGGVFVVDAMHMTLFSNNIW